MIEDKISELIAQPLQSLGYRLINVKMQSFDKSRSLQVFAEKNDYKSLDISDCQEITKMVSEILDEEDTISGAYNLEVSSPGLDRPLVSEQDYRRFEGFLISLKSKMPIDGSRKFKGRVKLQGDEITLIDDRKKEVENILTIGFADVDSAKIIITDELLKTKGKIN